MLRRCFILLPACMCFLHVQASWYWPFGDDEEAGSGKVPRLSEIMEPASLLIDEASDAASTNDVNGAVAKYRAALVELQKIEADYPDRADKPEFATLRTKKAYVNAAIDSLLMNQVRDNAKVVAVSDTEELERKLAEEKAKKAAEQKKVEDAKKNGEKQPERTEKKPTEKPKTEPGKPAEDAKDPSKGRAEAKPGSARALNLDAMKLAEAGEFREAEKLLDKAIKLYPRSYFAYYNMAWLILESNPENITGARRYYETGRSMGGKRDKALEAELK